MVWAVGRLKPQADTKPKRRALCNSGGEVFFRPVIVNLIAGQEELRGTWTTANNIAT